MTERTSPIYGQIEDRYGFALPAEYRRMWERGWFDLKAGEGLDLYAHPERHSYLWLNEMEWMPLEAIRDNRFPEYCKSGFVPFAFTGGGDHWCWHPASANCGITPVVLCPRDSKIGEFYASNFLGALYRQSLEFASYVKPEDEAEARIHLKRWVDDLGPLLPSPWSQTLANVARSPLQTWKEMRYEMSGLLRRAEYNEIVRRDLVFPLLDQEIQWMED